MKRPPKRFGNGGETPKFKAPANAQKVTEVPSDYNKLGVEGNKTYYDKKAASAIPGGSASAEWKQSIINQLQSGVSPQSLVEAGHISAAAIPEFQQYYKPIYTEQNPVTQAPKQGIPLDVSNRIDRKQVFTGNLEGVNQFMYPDVNAGYSKPTMRYFDAANPDKEIDINKLSYGNDKKPVFTYINSAPGVMGTVKSGVGQNIGANDSLQTTQNPLTKAYSGGFAYGGIVKKLKGYANGTDINGIMSDSLQQQQNIIDQQNAQKAAQDQALRSAQNQQGLNNGIGIGSQLANLGGNYLQSQSFGSDGTVNVGQATGAGALKGAGKGASIGMMLGPEGAAVGAGLGALIGAGTSYFGAKDLNSDIAYGKTQAQNDKLRQQQQDKFSQGLSKQMADRQAGYAKGGEIKGKGGPKDDKIKAKVEAGSFIVPAENAHKAKEIKKVIAPKKKDEVATLNEKNGEEIRLSDGEFKFTPEEKDKIIKHFGSEMLEMLAPNAKDMDDNEYDEIEEHHMADGGELSSEKAKIMLKDNQANGKPLSSAQKRFFGWVAGGRHAEGGEIEPIHINPNHKGMFRRWAAEHQMSVAEAASHVMANKDKYSPHTIKMAVFAHNFTGKCMGGMVKKYAEGGEVGYADGGKVKGQKETYRGQTVIWDGKNWVTQDGSIKYAPDVLDETLKARSEKAAKEENVYQGQKFDMLKRHYDLIKNDPSRKAEADRLYNQLNPAKQTANNIPSKSGAAIEKALGSSSSPLNTSNSKVGLKTNTNRFIPSNLNDEDVTPPPMQKVKGSTLAADSLNPSNSLIDSALAQQKLSDEANKSNPNKTNYWNVASGIANQLGGLGNYLLPYKQYQLGQQYLAQTGSRPKGQIDPDFLKSLQTAQANAKFGYTPEEQAALNMQNVNALRAGQNAAKNYSGGSASTAYNLTRDAANDYYSRGLQQKLADKNLMFQKQSLANDLVGQKANMNRQLFQDNLAAYKDAQQAGSNLVGAGLQNLIGANRYNQELQFQRQYQNNSNPWQNYNINV